MDKHCRGQRDSATVNRDRNRVGNKNRWNKRLEPGWGPAITKLMVVHWIEKDLGRFYCRHRLVVPLCARRASYSRPLVFFRE